MIPDEETTLSELLERLRATAAAAIEAKESAERMAIQAFADLRDRCASQAARVIALEGEKIESGQQIVRLEADIVALKRPKRSEAEEAMARALVTLGWPRDTGVNPVQWAERIAAAGPGPLAVENAVVAAEKERDAALTESRALLAKLDSADKATRLFLGQIEGAQAAIVAALKMGPTSATLAELVAALIEAHEWERSGRETLISEVHTLTIGPDSVTSQRDALAIKVADMRLALDGLHHEMVHHGRWRTEAHAARERECDLFCDEAGKVPGFTVRDPGSPIGIFREVVANLTSAQTKPDLGLRAGVDKLIENTRGILGATGDEGLTDAAARVVMERDVLKMRVADLTFKPRVSLEEVQAALAKLAAQYAPRRTHGIASELVAKSITSMQENLAAVGWADALGQVILSGIRAGVERGLDCMGESYEEQQAKANAEVDKLAAKVLVAKLKKLRPWAMVHNFVEYICERTAQVSGDTARGWAMHADDVGHALWLCGFHPGDDPREVFKVAAKRAAEWQEIEALLRGRITRLNERDKSRPGLTIVEAVEGLLADMATCEQTMADDSAALAGVRAALLKAAGLVKSTRTTLDLVAELVDARDKARRDLNLERASARDSADFQERIVADYHALALAVDPTMQWPTTPLTVPGSSGAQRLVALAKEARRGAEGSP